MHYLFGLIKGNGYIYVKRNTLMYFLDAKMLPVRSYYHFNNSFLRNKGTLLH